MIARITGTLVEKGSTAVLVEVAGIAYEIEVPMSTLYQLPECGAELTLLTHFVVREDAQLLYGFYEQNEKTLFRTLIRVSGVGPKLALTILSGMAVGDFVRAVHSNDVAALVKMPGVGKKTAERLLVEVRDRLSDFGDPELSAASPSVTVGAPPQDTIAREAETALISLGYKPQHAAQAIAAVLKQSADIVDSEDLIRAALKSLA